VLVEKHPEHEDERVAAEQLVAASSCAMRRVGTPEMVPEGGPGAITRRHDRHRAGMR